MPGKRGTSALLRPISRIKALTCSAPPPPNGIAVKRAGSPLRDRHAALRAHVAQRVGEGEAAERGGLLFDDPA